MKLTAFLAEGFRKTGNSSGTKIGIVSVALSMAVIIMALNIVAGFRAEIKSKASGFIGELSMVMPGQGAMNENYPFSSNISYLDSLASERYISHIDRVAYTTGLLKTEDNVFGVCLKGVDSLYNFSFFQSVLTDGTLPDYSGGISNEIIISQRMSENMGYGIGDKITAYFIRDELKVRSFTICGIYDAQLEEIDNTLAIADIRQVRRINGWESDEVSSMEVSLRPGIPIEIGFAKLQDYLFNHGNDDDPGLFATSVKRAFPHLFDWLNVLDFNVAIVLILMMLVAGFNMISTLLIILFEKISAIGLLKAVGMENAAIGKIFRNIALNIVLKGLVIGNAVAFGLSAVQKIFRVISLDASSYFVKFVPIEFKWGYIIAIDVISVLVIMLILRLTSLFIARVSPDKTMRMA
ncbi:MAG: ABC transporter permease [Bacteroidales bacterium]|nr:ABC transporter permease [Bacteroidales bacterium]